MKKYLPTSPDDYVWDNIYIAEGFYTAAKELLKNPKFEVLDPAGFCAAQAAELYLKAYAIGITNSLKVYKKLRNIKPAHDLILLMNIVFEYDPSISKLKSILTKLNKYGGDKRRFTEYQYKPDAETDFGTDEIHPISDVRKYVREKLGFGD